MAEYLIHYGVLGMKWGQRKSRIKSAVKSRVKERSQNKAIKRDRKQASKRRKTMSDAELSQRINRLEKERRLKTLTEQEISPGRSATKKFLKEQGGKMAGTIIGGAAAGAATYYVKKTLSGNANYSGKNWENFFREIDKKR